MESRIRHFDSRAAVAMAALAVLLALQAANSAELAIGARMPSFALKGTHGQTMSSDSLGGKRALVVIFMDYHCNYCQAYQSRLMDLQKAYADQGVQIVLINPNGTAGSAQELKAEGSNPFPYLMDDTQNVAKAFGATRTPEVFVFGSERKLVYRGQIDDNTEAKMVRRNDLKLALDAVLKGAPQAIEKPVTSPFGCSIKWRQ